TRICVHELRSLLHDLVEDRRRIELGREQPPRARELLGERTRRALGLEELASLECAARRVRKMTRELEVIVCEEALLLEEDDDNPTRIASGGLDRHREKRAVAAGRRGLTPGRGQPVVVRERRRREH